MIYRNKIILIITAMLSFKAASSQQVTKANEDSHAPKIIPGYELVWHDEFNNNGKPDTANWKYEHGFVRNEELQWYQPNNANCKNGSLVIEGKREQQKNTRYKEGSSNWQTNRKYAEYTSASINTGGLHHWLFGRFEIRAKIDTAKGSWPAIWTLGVEKEWPSNGENDIMEFYRVKDAPTILANTAWGTEKRFSAKWNTQRIPLSKFTAADPDWVKKFHVWRMDWDKDSINLFLDDELLNTTLVSQTLNPNGSNPFLQPHYLLLNLALGGNGGDPSKSSATIKYEVDYVRVYQKK
jgi:beta-glucanase (GH16 family)